MRRYSYIINCTLNTHVIVVVEFMCLPYNFQVNGNQGHFFEEEVVYWTPGSDCVTIYEQLAQKRFREIARDQVK